MSFAQTGTLIPGTKLRIGQEVVYQGSIRAIEFGRCWRTGRIIGPKRKLVVVDFGDLGEFECKPENLVPRDELD